MWWIIAGVAAVGAAAWGPMVSNVEQAKYTVVETHGAIEIRDYAPMIVAETDVTGEREEAIEKGFRIIADYIFGNNAPAREVAMTAPVTQAAGDSIAMTAPVTQNVEGNSWKVRFVMPSSYTMESLPRPNDSRVTLLSVEGKRYAAIRFSGMAGKESLGVHLKELQESMREKNLLPLSGPVYAFYNPPWTLPFLRRNEIMIETARP